MPILISRIVTLVIVLLFFISACESKEDKELEQAQKMVKNYYTDYAGVFAVYVKKLDGLRRDGLEDSDDIEEFGKTQEAMNEKEKSLAAKYFTKKFGHDALICGPNELGFSAGLVSTCFMGMFFDSPSPPYQIGKAIWLDPAHGQAAIPIKVGLCPDERELPKDKPEIIFYDVERYRLLVKKEQGVWKIFDTDNDQGFSYKWELGKYVPGDHEIAIHAICPKAP